MSIFTFTVSGTGEFPVDMMRFERAWPRAPSDSKKIQESDPSSGRFEVDLQSADPPSQKGRWGSFGWRIEKINGRPARDK